MQWKKSRYVSLTHMNTLNKSQHLKGLRVSLISLSLSFKQEEADEDRVRRDTLAIVDAESEGCY